MKNSLSQSSQRKITSRSCIDVLSRITTIAICLFLMPESFTPSAQVLDKVVATVDQSEITQQEVDERIAGQLYALHEQIYALRKTALDNLIVQKLLEMEASRRKLTIEQLKVRWMSEGIEVGKNQVEEVYQQNLNAFGLMNPDEAREKIRLDLESQSRLKRYREGLARLRDTTEVKLLLEQPRINGLNRRHSTLAIKGPSQAKITLIEFSDFQCAYCREVQPTLQRLLQEFPDDLRLEFRHYPLEIHPFATLAAQAAYCASHQNRFWDFHDKLFAAEHLSDNTLLALADELKLNTAAFRKCLNSGEAVSAVITDTSLARRIGINGTPTFLLNGKLFRGSSTSEQFKREILFELKTLDSNPRNLTSTSLSKGVKNDR